MAHQRNDDSDEYDDETDNDITNDVIVTSDGAGGKRRNKTWRRPAADNVDRKQTDSSQSQPTTGGT